MSDFIIQGTLNGTAVVPPFFITKTDWGSKTGPFDSEAAARDFIREQLMPKEDSIASVDALVKTITAQVANLSNLQKKLSETSFTRDQLMSMEQDHAIRAVEMTFHPKTGSMYSVVLDVQSEGHLVSDMLAKAVGTLSKRVEKTLEEINRVAASIHTPSS